MTARRFDEHDDLAVIGAFLALADVLFTLGRRLWPR